MVTLFIRRHQKKNGNLLDKIGRKGSIIYVERTDHLCLLGALTYHDMSTMGGLMCGVIPPEMMCVQFG